MRSSTPFASARGSRLPARPTGRRCCVGAGSRAGHRARGCATVVQVAPATFAKLAPVPPASGVLAIAARPRSTLRARCSAPGPAPIVLLEQPSHPGNLGAVVRVAAAAGAAAVLTTGARDPWQPAALRGSAGLHFALPVASVGCPARPDRPLLAIDPKASR